jgi:hypothetical protein
LRCIAVIGGGKVKEGSGGAPRTGSRGIE